MKKEVEYLLKLLDVPGAIVSLQSTNNSFNITYGYSDLKHKTRVNVNDRWRIGSNTKMYVGIVLLQLYEEGLLDLNDKVSKHLVGLPEFYKDLTIEQVGTMRSGVPDYYKTSTFQKIYQEDLKRNWLTAELYAIAAMETPKFKPGTKSEYSNSNSIILGLIIERLTGNTLEYEIEKRIFNPVNLKETKFQTNTSLRQPHMNGYEYVKKLKDVTHINISWAWAAGAISSTLKDSIKFIKYVSNQKHQPWHLLDTSPYFNTPIYYGFHLLKIENFIGHSGNVPGYDSFILYEPETETSLVIVVNNSVNLKGILPAEFIGSYIINRLNHKIKLEDAITYIKNR